MANYTVTFPPSDAVSTNTDELSWAVYTGAGQTGTLLALGSATSGSQVTTGTITDNELVHGPNTRYLYITDGAGNPFDQSFNVEAVFTFEIAGTDSLLVIAADDATVQGQIEPDDTATIDLTEQATITVLASDTLEIGLIEAASIVEIIPKAGSDTLTADVQEDVVLSVTVIPADAAVVKVIESGTVAADIEADDPTTADVDESATISPQASDDVPVDTTDDATIAPQTSETGELEAEEVATVEAAIPGSETAQIDVEDSADLSAEIPGADTTEIDIEESAFIELLSSEYRGNRLRAEIYDKDDQLIGDGPIPQIVAASYDQTEDEVGEFSLTLPATLPIAQSIVSGNRIWLYREGEGLVYRGIVRKLSITVTAENDYRLVVDGDSLARELVWVNTLLGRSYSNEPIADVINDLLTGTGWSIGTIEATSANVTVRFEGTSIWAALVHLAKTYGWHVRENNIDRTIDMGTFGSDTGLFAMNVAHAGNRLAILPLADIQILTEQEELWNRIIPLGSGDGVNVMTLRYSDKTAPYTIESDVGPDGETYWYIEDEDSSGQHDERTRVLNFADVTPISNSEAEIRHAANTLYELAAAWLDWHSQTYESYSITILNLAHMVNGVPQISPGDTLRLRYSGVVTDAAGNRTAWKSIDTDVYVLAMQRQFVSGDGFDGWQLEVSTAHRRATTDEDLIAQVLDEQWAIKTTRRPYTYREIHGPYVESLNPSNDATFPVDFDESVTYLHKATLNVENRRVKSNVSAASAGGGQTSSSGGGQTTSSGGGQTSSFSGTHSHSVSTETTSSGGGQTSSSSGSHSHTVPAQTIFSSGDHFHSWATAQPTTSGGTPVYEQQLVTERSSGFSFGFGVIRGSSDGNTNTLYTTSPGAHTHNIDSETTNSSSNHSHSVSNHSHSVSGQTAQSGGSHTHTVSNHTHSVGNHTHEIDDHTHALVYGIYSGPVANSPNLNITINGVNRTVALGGPWNGSPEVDITQYLVDSEGRVLRQSNEIEISTSQLMDVRLTVKSLVTSLSVVPV